MKEDFFRMFEGLCIGGPYDQKEYTSFRERFEVIKFNPPELCEDRDLQLIVAQEKGTYEWREDELFFQWLGWDK